MKAYPNTQLVVVLDAEEVVALYHLLDDFAGLSDKPGMQELYENLSEFVNPRVGG